MVTPVYILSLYCDHKISLVIQSLCKSLGEKVRAQPSQNHRGEIILPIMGKNILRELSLVEKGMVIALFWFFRKISIASLIAGYP